jgi:hypothetical protein
VVGAEVREVLFPGAGAGCVVIVLPQDGSLMTTFDSLRVLTEDSINSLRPDQRFNVVWVEGDWGRPISETAVPATPANQKQAAEWLERFGGHNGDLIAAIRRAFAMDPDVIYLLANGDDSNNDAVVEAIRRLNGARPAGKKVRVNTVAWMDRAEEYEKWRKGIAAENGGRFRFAGETWVDGAVGRVLAGR